jgi:hypothetical protein
VKKAKIKKKIQRRKQRTETELKIPKRQTFFYNLERPFQHERYKSRKKNKEKYREKQKLRKKNWIGK